MGDNFSSSVKSKNLLTRTSHQCKYLLERFKDGEGGKTVNMASPSYLKIFQEGRGMMDEAQATLEQMKIRR